MRFHRPIRRSLPFGASSATRGFIGFIAWFIDRLLRPSPPLDRASSVLCWGRLPRIETAVGGGGNIPDHPMRSRACMDRIGSSGVARLLQVYRGALPAG